MEITKEQEARLQQALNDFRATMQLRDTMHVRVARRVTAILRIGMVSFGVVGIILLFMLYSFNSKMDEMIVALNTMNIQFSSMSKNMTTLKMTMAGMDNNIRYVPAITYATKNMTETVGNMRAEVGSMNKVIGSLGSEVSGITNQVDAMTYQIRTLEPAVHYMGGDINRMSGPMRMFNLFNPLY